VTIINRSEVVGKPLAVLLAGEGAIEFSVDASGTQLLRKSIGSMRFS
jgi:methylenetetrahydrofolate dehydrogenase (NAD+)